MTKLSDITARRWLPVSHRVLGQRLQPFALGHAMALEAYGCENPQSHPDLCLAVLICALKPGEFTKRWDKKWFMFQVRVWLWLLGRKLEKLTKEDPDAAMAALGAQFAAFDAYVKHYAQAPEYRVREASDDGEGANGAPFIQHVRVYLMEKLGYSADEVLRLPYGDALLDYYTSLEIAAHITLVDDASAEQAEAMAAEANDPERHAETLRQANIMAGFTV